MSPLDHALQHFHTRNRKALEQTARDLLNAGIKRVYFGLNFYNDEGDPADYSVVERLDGSTETLEEWHPLLDLQLFSSVPYCNAYVFQVQTATVEPDPDGGLIDVGEADSRAYHTQEQREMLEDLAEELDEGIDSETAMWLYNSQYREDFSGLSEALRDRGFVRMYFGVDSTLEGYPMSDYLILEDAQGTGHPQQDPPEFFDPGLLEDLPQYGAFVFDVQTSSVSIDEAGGMVESESGWTRAYHTQEERMRLEQLATSEN
ncbi:hypothetical protein [Deinococcus cellulosilyticus]|uniref:Uncharacterized protein n=1 Tax=Deinococcus cellulosilyticus (strain DSM 18568 / NBRC 106333 / KACC 11606 / 5516J-15) TaxID=1223518 RepID=A0A511N2C2_DEIC1|nr:hypothetical protein [Deinococcus cellulosilyticus]GEM47004.1 hypothetical protein DC3_26390 [Deinococcus cellulosilyticus NBRC 106333 = KACC 11606]